ncbi:PASTA domain-containing protein [Microbispora sp. CA-102843]|uniref:PASTA domain-containing protein n=1 Tax=Microbispora sp. CA-102843 TaxID=3239952 RepID=UPI003D932ED9
MARRKSVNLFWPIMIAALVMGGCMNLVNSVFGDGDDKPVQAAEVLASPSASTGPLPNLMKKTLAQAQNQVEALGLELLTQGIGDYDYCDDRSDCFVYRMTPKAGTVVQPGGVVAVRVVTREEWAFYKKHRTMPNVVGWAEDRADDLFDPIDASVTSSNKESASVPVGQDRVIAQSPKPGARLRVGQKIKLVIGYNFGSTSSSGGGGGGGGVDIDVHHHSHKSRFCSRHWWC